MNCYGLLGCQSSHCSVELSSRTGVCHLAVMRSAITKRYDSKRDDHLAAATSTIYKGLLSPA